MNNTHIIMDHTLLEILVQTTAFVFITIIATRDVINRITRRENRFEERMDCMTKDTKKLVDIFDLIGKNIDVQFQLSRKEAGELFQTQLLVISNKLKDYERRQISDTDGGN